MQKKKKFLFVYIKKFRHILYRHYTALLNLIDNVKLYFTECKMKIFYCPYSISCWTIPRYFYPVAMQSSKNLGLLYNICPFFSIISIFSVLMSHSLLLPAVSVWGSHLSSTVWLIKKNLLTLIKSILILYPNHPNHFLSISAIKSGALYNSLRSWLLLIL
jgi:hypothetical protein